MVVLPDGALRRYQISVAEPASFAAALAAWVNLLAVAQVVPSRQTLLTVRAVEL
jgi:hypothetical protein